MKIQHTHTHIYLVDDAHVNIALLHQKYEKEYLIKESPKKKSFENLFRDERNLFHIYIYIYIERERERERESPIGFQLLFNFASRVLSKFF